MFKRQDVALRLAVAQIIAGSPLWTVHADPQKAGTDAIAESLQANRAQARMEEQRTLVRTLLGMEKSGDETLIDRKNDYGTYHDAHAVFVKLLALTDDEVMTILTFCAAETLPCGSDLVEQIGVHLEVDISAQWTPDDAFFDLFRDKEAINAMLAENGGQSVAEGDVTATAKVQVQIIRDFANGKNCRKPKTGWKPQYMDFPMKCYTKREKTIEAMKTGQAIVKAAKTA